MKQYKNPIIPTSADGRTADYYVIRHDGKYYPNDSPLERAVIYRIEENGAEIKLSERIE